MIVNKIPVCFRFCDDVAFGCEDPILDAGSTLLGRIGDTATVACQSDAVAGVAEATTSKLKCVDGKWVGATQFCSPFSGHLTLTRNQSLKTAAQILRVLSSLSRQSCYIYTVQAYTVYLNS